MAQRYKPIDSGDFEPRIRALEEALSVEVVGEERKNLVVDGGVPSDESPATAAFNAALLPGGAYYLPKGRYFIEPQGANAGGISVSLTDDIDLLMDQDAEFFTAAPGLDNNFFALNVPIDGVGLPSGRKIKVTIRGGRFDGREQKNSTSVPLSPTYPPHNVGATATADCFNIHGEYQAGGVGPFIAGIGHILIEDVSTYTGDHWQSAGGDQHFSVGQGADMTVIRRVRCQGARDLGIYATRASDGLCGGPVHVYDSEFINCFYGVAFKRSMPGFVCANNRATGCVIAWQVNHNIGVGGTGGLFLGNTEVNCSVSTRLSYTRNTTVLGGLASNMGAFDGTGAPVVAYPASILLVQGSTDCQFVNIRGEGVDPGHLARNFRITYNEGYTHATDGLIVSQRNLFSDCRASGGFNGVSSEISGEADYNYFLRCRVRDGGAPDPIVAANSSVERVDEAAARIFHTAVGFGQGTVGLPAIYREGQRAVGVDFATNKVFFTLNSQERLGATTRGAYATLSVFADNATALAGGLVAKDIYKTATGELRIVI